MGQKGFEFKMARGMIAAGFAALASDATGGDAGQAAMTALMVHMFNAELEPPKAKEVFKVINGSAEDTALVYDELDELLATSGGRKSYNKWASKSGYNGKIKIDLACTGCKKYTAKAYTEQRKDGSFDVYLPSLDSYFNNPTRYISMGYEWTPLSYTEVIIHEVFAHGFENMISHSDVARYTNKVMKEIVPTHKAMDPQRLPTGW